MTTQKLVILGAGGFGREILFQLLEINENKQCYDILGFVDNDANLHGKKINNYPVLGDDSWLIDIGYDINVVVAIGNPQKRKCAIERMAKNKKMNFPNIIAENVKYSDSVTMGKGCIICLSSVLTVNVSLGDFVVVNLDCTIGHDSSLKDFATLHPSVNVSGNVSIGTCVEIGTGANIIQGMKIGDSSIIGAGSVVMRNVPPGCTVLGIPARRIN